MTPDGADVALVRSLALLRLFAWGLEEDEDAEWPSGESMAFILDANVPVFFAGPVSDASHMQIFAAREAFGIPEVEYLAEAERRLITAFARSEGDRLPAVLAKRAPTHVLRPHLLEISWRKSRIQHELVDKMTSSDLEDRDQERQHIRSIERDIRKAQSISRSDAKAFFDSFLSNFQPSMVRQVEALSRLGRLVERGLLGTGDIKRWEGGNRANPTLWTFFFDGLIAIRGSRREDVHFNVLQDAEALALIAQYIRATGKHAVFVTFDSTIHRLFDSIYSSTSKPVADNVKALLPAYNFVRHPIIYTPLVSEYVEQDNSFRLRGFIREIDLIVRTSGDQAVSKKVLADIAYHNELSHIDHLIGGDAGAFHESLRPYAEKLTQDILFIHEEGAVRAVEALLRTEPDLLAKAGSRDYVERATMESALDIMGRYVDERSGQKAAELVKSLVAISILETEGDEGELQVEDAARLILYELSDSAITRAPIRGRQLLRNMPGWIRLDEVQTGILEQIAKDTRAFTASLLQPESALDHNFYLLGALVAAVDDDWFLSERQSLRARSIAEEAGDTRSWAEAQYWVAVSRRHQRDPGITKLVQARRNLQRAIAAAADDLDILRYESELTALYISLPYHQYVYGAETYAVPLNVGPWPNLAETSRVLDQLIVRLGKVCPIPDDALKLRLAVQLFESRCSLDLFSWGLPPGSGGQKRETRHAARQHYDRLTYFCTLRRDLTLPIPVQFTRHAMGYVLLQDVQDLQKIVDLSQSADDILIPFDRRKILDFLLVTQSPFGPGGKSAGSRT